MKSSVTTVAYPTIPIVFVSSVRENRVPLHDTMGLAVTDLKGETRSETTVKALRENKIEFFLEGKPLDAGKTRDIEAVVAEFQSAAGSSDGVRAESTNYQIYSGSSDSGAAALVRALDELYETHFSLERLAELGNRISESAGRAVYGGMNAYIVDGPLAPYGRQIASEVDLKGLRIFAMGFDYESRISAAEIFALTRANLFYEYRLKMVPTWIGRIKQGLLQKDWSMVFANAEDNCANAHYLIESSGRRCRKKEMMNAVIDVEEIRASGLPVYWTAGGGKVINAFSWGKEADSVLAQLKKRGQKPVEYKVASGAKVIRKA